MQMIASSCSPATFSGAGADFCTQITQLNFHPCVLASFGVRSNTAPSTTVPMLTKLVAPSAAWRGAGEKTVLTLLLQSGPKAMLSTPAGMRCMRRATRRCWRRSCGGGCCPGASASSRARASHILVCRQGSSIRPVVNLRPRRLSGRRWSSNRCGMVRGSGRRRSHDRTSWGSGL